MGLLVSVLQVATQLQEMTFSYIPKLIATGVVLIVLGPWMMQQITHFALAAIKTIPNLG